MAISPAIYVNIIKIIDLAPGEGSDKTFPRSGQENTEGTTSKYPILMRFRGQFHPATAHSQRRFQ